MERNGQFNKLYKNEHTEIQKNAQSRDKKVIRKEVKR